MASMASSSACFAVSCLRVRSPDNDLSPTFSRGASSSRSLSSHSSSHSTSPLRHSTSHYNSHSTFPLYHSTSSSPPRPLLVMASSSASSSSSAAASFPQFASSPVTSAPQSLAREREQMEQIRRLASDFNYHLTVADCMTQGQLVIARTTTPVYEAIEALVEHRITGMPVADDKGRVIGVVSDYDLLALDSISGNVASCDAQAAAAAAGAIFPPPNSSWRVFKEIQKLLGKAHGQTVGDVMTANPVTVRPMTNLEDAARMLLDSKFRRLPVVDEEGKLVGLLTRGNVVRAALMMRRAAEGRGMAPAGGN